MESDDKLITLAIHTYEKALILKTLLEKEGIEVVINNVNLIQPVISSGVRVRIHEKDLPLALKIIESSSNIAFSQDYALKQNPVILIPVDFSDYSLKACAIGFDFAKKLHGDVVLLHSYLLMNYGDTMPFAGNEGDVDITTASDDKQLVKAVTGKMQDFERLLHDKITAGYLPQVNFTTAVLEGVPETTILYYAKQKNASLIVMGTRGKDKKEAELIGSVTAEVLDANKFPIFTVPEQMSCSKVSDIKNVVFFSNFNQQDLISFDQFARMLDGVSLSVTLVPIAEDSSGDTLHALNSLLRYCQNHYRGFSFTTHIIPEARFLDDFDNFVAQHQIDLILVPNKKRNIFARLFSPSIAHRMIFHSDIPMLVIPI